VIRLDHLCRNFQVGEQLVHALDDITLRIDRGEYVSIMGPSGSGKSTLLNILGLLDTPTSGRYRLGEVNTSSLEDDELAHIRQTTIGFVFQSFHLVPRLTAFENVELPMLLAEKDRGYRRVRGLQVLDQVGLRNRVDHRPDQLSGGERQRVAIARAIVMQPQILLADEPTGNLDTASGSEIIDIIEELNTGGLTLVVVTHDPAIGGRAPGRIGLLDGKMVEDRRTCGNSS